MKKAKHRVIRLFCCLFVMILSLSVIAQHITKVNAATNQLATNAINTLQTKSGFILNESTNNLNCYQFASKVFKQLFNMDMGSQNSDFRSISTTTMNLVGAHKGITSNSSIKELLLKAYPGDIIQYRSTATTTHAAVIKAVNSSGITLYHSTTEGTGYYCARENTVSWDSAGKYYIGSFTDSSHGISLYHSKNYDTVFGDNTYNIAYNANGGTGTMASRTITEGTTFTPSKCTFTKSGYYFAGYNVCRKSDSKWYVKGTGWLTNSEIINSGYTKSVYNNGTNYVFNGSWTSGVNPGETYTFYPIWKPNNPELHFYQNLSGCNYILGGSLKSDYSKYIKSRDTSVYTVSVDSNQKLNNQSSLKIVGKSAGSIGKDLAFATDTNQGEINANQAGDNKKMTLKFWAKSSVNGAKMYLRWGNITTPNSIALTTEWKLYTVDMSKNKYSSEWILPYFDTAGTFYLNNISLFDENGSNFSFRSEEGGMIQSSSYTHGSTYSQLPVPERDGYTFLGWYTEKEGGTQITTSTNVADYNTNVYAHWRKDISNSPISEIILPSGRKYSLYDNAVEWEEARKLCENAGGHLVTINSQEENDLIHSMIKERNQVIWLGAKYNESTNSREWITGEPFYYTNWADGEPTSNNTSIEFFVQMYPFDIGLNNTGGKWNDSNGANSWSTIHAIQNSMYICEFEPLYGDTDGDREITITDATNIQKSIVSLIDFSDEQTKYFDINNDGKKDIKDVSLIQKIVAGIITAWRVSEY